MRALFILMALLVCTTPARAQQSDQPVEISAKSALEWDRNAKTYTALDDARARQGAFEVTSKKLTAFYNGADGTTDIYRMTGEGVVVLSSPPYKAFGDKAVYDVKTGNATLTGEGLKLSTAAETLTARDKIEFFGGEQRLTATGDALAVRATDRLKADVISGFFEKGPGGKMALSRMTAEGSVVINTLKETVYGDRGTYDVRAQKAVLTGAVKILQGENKLEGTRAEIDLTTGLSKLFADAGAASNGRVKGVFYPKKGK